ARLADEAASAGVVERVVVEGAVGGLPPEHHDAILVAHRKITEQQRLRDREHGRGEPDAQRERQHRSEGEAGGTSKLAAGESDGVHRQSRSRCEHTSTGYRPPTCVPWN